VGSRWIVGAARALARVAPSRDPAAARLAGLGDHLTAAGDVAGADAGYDEHVAALARDPALMQAGAALAANRIPDAEAPCANAPRAGADGRRRDAHARRARRALGRTRTPNTCSPRAWHSPPASTRRASTTPWSCIAATSRPKRWPKSKRCCADRAANPGYRNLHAVVLCRIGDFAPALDIYADLLRQYPTQTQIWMSYGHALKTAGRQDEAIAAYRRCIALEPAFGEAWWSLANLKTFRFDADDLRADASPARNPRLPPITACHLDSRWARRSRTKAIRRFLRALRAGQSRCAAA
jgi:tetratricopeptide (TPR) repeat protein